ncbi:required for meiotic nuclear division protein 1 homolog [Zophobas morio]|uniref:required for meiotic nuclear division protein 1 homolog n=1 Tax=Zophobas morio TaxID=2755281 RepID=UPI00308311F9
MTKKVVGLEGTFLPSTDGLNNRIATRAKNKHKKREKARHNSKFQGKALEFRICKALCTSEAFNLEALTSLLHSKDFKITSFSSVGEETDVIHVYSFSERGEIFFFKSGTIVLWNISNSEMLEVNKLLHKIEVRPYISKIVAEEEIYYKIDDSRLF